MYANRQAARDGFIPEGMISMLYPVKSPAKLATRLVDAGLWHRVPGGYQIHQFTEWNQTKQQRDDELAKGRDRAAASYARRQGEKKQNSSPEESAKNSDSSGSTPLPLHSATSNPPPLPPTTESVRDVRAMAVRALRDRAGSAFEHGDCASWPEVQAICAAFLRTYGRTDEPRHGGDSRAELILQRLAEDYSVDLLVQAVERSKNADWMAKRSNQSLTTILKNGATVEKLAALTSSETSARPLAKNAPRQPDSGYRPAEHALEVV